MIEIRNLSAGYQGRPVLQACSAHVPSGKITALLGLNGIGKTTLIRAMLGFIPVSDGSVLVDGKNLTDKHARISAREHAKLLSYVPQSSDERFSYTCREFVAMGAASALRTFSSPGKETLLKAREILDSLGCGHLADRPLDEVSGGENRMAYLARAIMQDAKYMLMDEPVNSLDLSRQHSFLRSLQSYIAKSGHGCLLSVHDPAMILPVAEHFLVMHEGRIVCELSKADADFEQRFDDALRLLYGTDLIITHMEKGIHLSY